MKNTITKDGADQLKNILSNIDMPESQLVMMMGFTDLMTGDNALPGCLRSQDKVIKDFRVEVKYLKSQLAKADMAHSEMCAKNEALTNQNMDLFAENKRSVQHSEFLDQQIVEMTKGVKTIADRSDVLRKENQTQREEIDRLKKELKQNNELVQRMEGGEDNHEIYAEGKHLRNCENCNTYSGQFCRYGLQDNYDCWEQKQPYPEIEKSCGNCNFNECGLAIVDCKHDNYKFWQPKK